MHWCYTELQEHYARIADDIVAECWDHVWFVVQGEDCFVYDDGEVLHKINKEG